MQIPLHVGFDPHALAALAAPAPARGGQLGAGGGASPGGLVVRGGGRRRSVLAARPSAAADGAQTPGERGVGLLVADHDRARSFRRRRAPALPADGAPHQLDAGVRVAAEAGGQLRRRRPGWSLCWWSRRRGGLARRRRRSDHAGGRGRALRRIVMAADCFHSSKLTVITTTMFMTIFLH